MNLESLECCSSLLWHLNMGCSGKGLPPCYYTRLWPLLPPPSVPDLPKLCSWYIDFARWLSHLGDIMWALGKDKFQAACLDFDIGNMFSVSHPFPLQLASSTLLPRGSFLCRGSYIYIRNHKRVGIVWSDEALHRNLWRLWGLLLYTWREKIGERRRKTNFKLGV